MNITRKKGVKIVPNVNDKNQGAGDYTIIKTIKKPINRDIINPRRVKKQKLEHGKKSGLATEIMHKKQVTDTRRDFFKHLVKPQ